MVEYYELDSINNKYFILNIFMACLNGTPNNTEHCNIIPLVFSFFCDDRLKMVLHLRVFILLTYKSSY